MPAKEQFFTQSILRWNRDLNTRQMPWKGEQDAYRIWLSEVILQQTRVEQGLSYYRHFIEKYPTVAALATAPEQEVFKSWEGLGYYSRCRNLVATARYIAFELKGVFPNNYQDILSLKGVGPYTAAAISSFAFSLPHAVLDGNVFRVLARYFGSTVPIDTIAGKKHFTAVADRLLDETAPGIYNQAIMDFGAVICTPRLPLCYECVLRTNCTAFKKDLVTVLPVKEKKMIKQTRFFCYIIAAYKNKIYVRQRTEKDIWQDLWEFILIERTAKITPGELFADPEFKRLAGGQAITGECSAPFIQQLTHRRIEAIFVKVKLRTPLNTKSYIAVSQEEMRRLAFPRIINRYLEQAVATG